MIKITSSPRWLVLVYFPGYDSCLDVTRENKAMRKKFIKLPICPRQNVLANSCKRIGCDYANAFLWARVKPKMKTLDGSNCFHPKAK